MRKNFTNVSKTYLILIMKANKLKKLPARWVHFILQESGSIIKAASN